MTERKSKRLLNRIKRVGCIALAVLMVLETGCGRQESPVMRPEDVELLDPAGVPQSFETVVRRDLYDTSVYSALVCPYVREYRLDSSISFDAYDAFPGRQVKKGDELLHGKTENIDKQIENLEKSITEKEESYQEFLKENKEAMEKPLENQKIYGTAVSNMEKDKPEEFLVETDTETGEDIQRENPAYAEWNRLYRQYDGMYRSANQTIMELEEALKERTELYELDHAYDLLQLKRLKEDRSNYRLSSDMIGSVVAMQLFTEGEYVGSDQPLVAVGDTSRKLIRSEFVARTYVDKAQEVYAIVNGKRYEVEYEPMETEEYDRLKLQNGYVYSTFYLKDDADEVKIGDYAVIVLKKRSVENVLTVPNDALNREGMLNYVYVLKDGERVYTAVSTGMTDNVYTEIRSGLEEGDKVLTKQAVTGGTETVKVEYGELYNTFTALGYLYYPSSQWVTNPVKYGTCYYVESLVALYQQVKKGDVLGRVRVTPDTGTIERYERKLQRERERLEDLKKAGEKENEKEIARREEGIQELEKLLADMRKDAAVTEIRAPRDGIIIRMASAEWPGLEEGSMLYSGQELYLLADEQLSYLFVEDPNNVLTYGNQAEISFLNYLTYRGDQLQITDKDKENSVTGEIVNLNKMSLSKELVSGFSLIKVAAEDMSKLMGSTETEDGRWLLTRYGVTVRYREVKNVLLVPRRAVKTISGSTYVKVKLENGEIQYRSFVSGGSDGAYFWVVEGLTEGMEICLE